MAEAEQIVEAEISDLSQHRGETSRVGEKPVEKGKWGISKRKKD